MKTLTWASAILLAGALIYGCASDGVQTVQTNNHDIHVTFLFEHDGCKVYRFMDAGNYIYYANCGLSSDTAWNHMVGRVNRHEQVPTNQ
jgi:hypothetical protein